MLDANKIMLSSKGYLKLQLRVSALQNSGLKEGDNGKPAFWLGA